MDGCTHRPMPNPQPAPPAPAPAPASAPPVAAPQEATGDSESDAPVSALTVGEDYRPSVAAAGYAEDDDAESCSGAGGARVPAAGVNDDGDDGRGEEDDVAVEGDENEVDSRMCVPWWRRTVVKMDASAGAGGGCARPQAAAAAAEGGPAAVVAGPSHAAESNRLFWEACIAHGY